MNMNTPDPNPQWTSTTPRPGNVSFLVGSDPPLPFSVQFHVAVCSLHLLTVMFTERLASAIKLPDIDPEAFDLYIIWLTLNKPSELPTTQFGTSIEPLERIWSWDECRDLIHAHILGSEFSDVEFQAYIQYELEKWLKPRQRPDLELLNFVMLDKRVSGEFKEFVARKMFATEGNVSKIWRYLAHGEVEQLAAEDAESHRSSVGGRSGTQNDGLLEVTDVQRKPMPQTRAQLVAPAAPVPTPNAMKLLPPPPKDQIAHQPEHPLVARFPARLSFTSQRDPRVPRMSDALPETPAPQAGRSDSEPAAPARRPTTFTTFTSLEDAARFASHLHRKVKDTRSWPIASSLRKRSPSKRVGGREGQRQSSSGSTESDAGAEGAKGF